MAVLSGSRDLRSSLLVDDKVSRITANVSGSRAAMWAYVLTAMLLGLIFYLVSIALESLTTQHRGASPKGDNT